MPVFRLERRRDRWVAPLAALFLSSSAVGLARAAPLEAALRTASDLAFAAGTRLQARIEDVRDPDVTAMSGVDLDLRIARAPADRALEPFLTPPEPDLPTLLWDNDFDWRAVPAAELNVDRRATSDGSGDLWGSGVIEFGRERGGMIASRRSSADVASGLDRSLSARATAGAAIGFNRAPLDGAGTLDLSTLSTYGTVAPTRTSFVDLVAGLGPLRASAGGAIASGEAAFATITYGARMRAGAFTVSPYGRVETSLVRARPSGSGAAALLASRTSAVAGIRTTRSVRGPDSTLKPGLRLELRQDLARAQTPGHRANREFIVAPAIEATLAPHWTARVEHRSRFGGDGDTRSLQLRVETAFWNPCTR